MKINKKIYAPLWTDPNIKKISIEARLLAAYLLTGTQGNILVFFKLPLSCIAEDLGFSVETVIKNFQVLHEIHFLYYILDNGSVIFNLLKLDKK